MVWRQEKSIVCVFNSHFINFFDEIKTKIYIYVVGPGNQTARILILLLGIKNLINTLRIEPNWLIRSDSGGSFCAPPDPNFWMLITVSKPKKTASLAPAVIEKTKHHSDLWILNPQNPSLVCKNTFPSSTNLSIKHPRAFINLSRASNGLAVRHLQPVKFSNLRLFEAQSLHLSCCVIWIDRLCSLVGIFLFLWFEGRLSLGSKAKEPHLSS